VISEQAESILTILKEKTDRPFMLSFPTAMQMASRSESDRQWQAAFRELVDAGAVAEVEVIPTVSRYVLAEGEAG
jgi:hypothetical protein